MAFDWSSVTEVELSWGKHKTARDGMCLLEMVAWFAGEKHSDQPKCACPELAAYGRRINDFMAGHLRDRLLKPIVPLIAGTAGTKVDRQRRAASLYFLTCRYLLASALFEWGLDDPAKRLMALETIGGTVEALRPLRSGVVLAAIPGYGRAHGLQGLVADVGERARVGSSAWQATWAADMAEFILRSTRRPTVTAEIAVEVLRKAIMVGPHEGFPAVDAPARHAALRYLVAA